MIVNCRSKCQAKCLVCLGHVQRAMYDGFVYEHHNEETFCREQEFADYLTNNDDDEVIQFDDWLNERLNNIAYANLSEKDQKSIDIDNLYK